MRILSSSPRVARSVLAVPPLPTVLVPLRLGLALLVLLAALLRLSLCAFFKGLLLPRRLLLRPAILCKRWLSAGLERPGLSTEARSMHGRLRVVIRAVGLLRVPVVHRTIVDLLVEGRLRMELRALASVHRRSVAMAALVVATEASLRLPHGPAELSLRVWTMSLEVITSIIGALGLPLGPTVCLVAILCLSLLWVVLSVSVIHGLTVPLMRIVGVLVVLLEAVRRHAWLACWHALVPLLLLLLLEAALIVVHLRLVSLRGGIVSAIAGILIEGPASGRPVGSAHPRLSRWLAWWPHEAPTTSRRT